MASKPDREAPSAENLPVIMDQYTYDMLSANKHVVKYVDDVLAASIFNTKEKSKFETLKTQLKEHATADGKYFIKFKDIQMLHKALKQTKQSEGTINLIN